MLSTLGNVFKGRILSLQMRWTGYPFFVCVCLLLIYGDDALELRNVYSGREILNVYKLEFILHISHMGCNRGP